MKIKTVKKIGEKYLINNKILVPYVKENKYYSLLDSWLQMNKDIELEEETVVEDKLSNVQIEYAKKKNKIFSKLRDPAMNLWDIQRVEALLCLYVQEAPTPFIDGLSESRGETKRVIAKKILSKSNDFLYKLGKATGQMQMQEKNKSVKNG